MEPIVKNLVMLGAGGGNDITRFLRKTPSSKEWNIYGFEPGFDMFLHLEHKFRNNKNVHLINAAAYTFDGTIKLYECGIGQNNGRSINPLKYNILSYYKEVESVDIVKWLRENIQKDSYNILVIDIEGAEYDVIDYLNANDMLSWVDKLYLEFHGEKIKDFDMNRERSMVDMLIKYYKDNVFIENYHQTKEFSEMNSELRRYLEALEK
jgi:FkbM family methyltransferase